MALEWMLKVTRTQADNYQMQQFKKNVKTSALVYFFYSRSVGILTKALFTSCLHTHAYLIKILSSIVALNLQSITMFSAGLGDFMVEKVEDV